MTVKELITKLLDASMDAKVDLRIPGEYITEDGIRCVACLFDVEAVQCDGSYVWLDFTDWRKKGADDEER